MFEGVLEPIGRVACASGASPAARWRGCGSATRLRRDLELNASGVALAIDLLDRIASLESRLAALSAMHPVRAS